MKSFCPSKAGNQFNWYVLCYISKSCKNKYRSQEPCASKQKQTYEWESSIETVRHKVQNRQRAKTDKEPFKYIKVQEQYEKFQKV